MEILYFFKKGAAIDLFWKKVPKTIFLKKINFGGENVLKFFVALEPAGRPGWKRAKYEILKKTKFYFLF